MLNKTKELKREINKLDSVEERLNILKDEYVGKTACILAPGPSLKEHDKDKLKSILKRDDIVVFSIKQAYHWSEDETDFHIMNTWNFDKEKGYDYIDNSAIVFYGLTKAYIPQQLDKILVKPSVCDIWIPISTPPYHNEQDSIQSTKDYDLFFQLRQDLEMRWGKSILYEQAIPLALYTGCKDIFTVGWDLGNPSLGENQGHSYSYSDFQPMKSDVKDIVEVIESTPELYDWFKKHDIRFRILSDTNPADDRFERIKDLESI